MYAILGAAGNVGFATVQALRKAGMPVRAIVRDEGKARRLVDAGAQVVVADLRHRESLAEAIGDADAVQLILPPAPQLDDPARDMLLGIESMAGALELTRTRRVLAISDYGAHIEENIGIPSIYRRFEDRLGRLASHVVLLRSAAHMQNWARVIPAALASGILPSFLDPVDMAVPTVSAPDVGAVAARLLLRPPNGDGIEVAHVEGPRRYSAADVASVLGDLVGRPIRAQAVPRSQWEGVLHGSAGASLVDLLIGFNDAQNMEGLIDVEPGSHQVYYGETPLSSALEPFSLSV